MNPLAIAKTVWDFLKDIPPFKDGIATAASWLFKGSPVFLRLVVVCFALLSALFLSIVWIDVEDTGDMVFRSFSAPPDGSRSQNSPIESLLLSNVSEGQYEATGKDIENLPKIKDDFLKAVDKIAGTLEIDKVVTSTSDTPLDVLRPAKTSPISESILTDRFPGFLYVPGVIFPSTLKPEADSGPGPEASSAFAQKADSVSLVKEYSFLEKDISLSRSISSDLCDEMTQAYAKTNGTVFSEPQSSVLPKYSQIYVIFRSGIGRLCETHLDPGYSAQRDYYKNKFGSDTLLQTRFYFQEAVDNPNGFINTDPYVDLAGNGIIRTFCRYLRVGKQDVDNKVSFRTDAVLCMDFATVTDFTNATRAVVSRYGGAVKKLSCIDVCSEEEFVDGLEEPLNTRLLGIFYPSAKITTSEIDSVTDKYNEAKNAGRESKFEGGIVPLDAPKGQLALTIPVEGKKGVSVLLVKLDLNSYQYWRTVWIIAAAVCVSITVGAVMLILADYGLKLKEQERAFTAVDTVMSDVPVPYARLNEDGKFEKVNESFASMLGYPTPTAAIVELRNYTYEEFLVDEKSKQEYRKIKDERRTRQPYRSYKIQMWVGGRPGVDPVKWLEVHGSDVPTPHSARNKPGQAFGILLPASAPGPVPVMDLTQGRAGRQTDSGAQSNAG